MNKDKLRKLLLDMLYCEVPNCPDCADKMNEILESWENGQE